jgi:hypothetical protein
MQLLALPWNSAGFCGSRPIHACENWAAAVRHNSNMAVAVSAGRVRICSCHHDSTWRSAFCISGEKGLFDINGFISVPNTCDDQIAIFCYSLCTLL